jgi:hypothetical protein
MKHPIIEGLKSALAYASGDASKGTATLYRVFRIKHLSLTEKLIDENPQPRETDNV